MTDLEDFWADLKPPPAPPGSFLEHLLRPGEILLLGPPRLREKFLARCAHEVPPGPGRVVALGSKAYRLDNALWGVIRAYGDSLPVDQRPPNEWPALLWDVVRVWNDLGGPESEVLQGALSVILRRDEDDYWDRVAATADLLGWLSKTLVAATIPRAAALFQLAFELGVLNHVWLDFDGLETATPQVLQGVQEVLQVTKGRGTYTVIGGANQIQGLLPDARIFRLEESNGEIHAIQG